MEGPKFNLSLVMTAHELVLDRILANAGPIQLAAGMDKGRNRIDWPVPGKKTAKHIWESLKNLNDVDARPLMLIGRDITVQVRLLGNTWVIQDANTGELKLHDGKPLASLNPTPNITVLGPWDLSRHAYRLMTEKQVDRIAALVTGPLVRLKLDFQRLTEANHQSLKSGYTDYARISFPYPSYGLSREIITVRCVSSDGKEPDPTSNVEN
jgi:hypothetical protein